MRLVVNVIAALSTQYKAALLMLRDCVEVCPDHLWTYGKHPRNFWRIAYHAAFYAHAYLVPGQDQIAPSLRSREHGDVLWAEPPVVEPYTKEEMLAFIDDVMGQIDPTLEILDLSSPDSGFDWYPEFPKLDHLILSIRHLQGHVGQLSEILMLHDVDTKWISRPKKPA
jgi:hypothetical protein